ncbi:MAG: N-acetyltransferase [Hyphomicrobiaceae bacterium]|nr:N-acetyltransferase [Hyphomicrobiaceae bacterium]
MIIRPERVEDQTDINHLHEEAFGPGRFAKTAYRLREGVEPVAALSLVALSQIAKDGARLVGSIRFAKISVGGKKGALLLGPLAVFVDYNGHRCGLRLMEQGLELARQQGFGLVVLVGDLAYYQKVGFLQVPAGQFDMPGPIDQSRMLALELQPGTLADYKGVIRGNTL